MDKNLVYDIGMHNGNDTAYYLSLGYSVVGIEANPMLVKKCKLRFSKEITDGRLVILDIGISKKSGFETFWVNKKSDEWSSFVKEVGCRDNTPCKPIKVKCTTLKQVIKKYGVPYYMKIDIERNDIYCLLDLDKQTIPAYISVEAHTLEYLIILYTLGYRSFKCIDQTSHNNPLEINNEVKAKKDVIVGVVKSLLFKVPPAFKLLKMIKSKAVKAKKQVGVSSGLGWHFPMGSSGPFGEESAGGWCTLEEVSYNWLHYYFSYRNRGSLNMNGWFDFHAKR